GTGVQRGARRRGPADRPRLGPPRRGAAAGHAGRGGCGADGGPHGRLSGGGAIGLRRRGNIFVPAHRETARRAPARRRDAGGPGSGGCQAPEVVPATPRCPHEVSFRVNRRHTVRGAPPGGAGAARMAETEEITRLLVLAREGGPDRLGAVFEALYPELVRLASSRLRGGEATLTPTVLVHELYLRISQGRQLQLNDRQHFFAASAKAMRWILVEHARARSASKRGGDQVMISLDEQIPDGAPGLTNVLALDEGL